MAIQRLVMCIVLIFLLISCDSLKKEPGSFSVSFAWDPANKPSYETEADWYAWATLEQWPGGVRENRVVKSQTAALSIDAAGRVNAQFADLSYGSERVVRFEVRHSSKDTDPIVYYGTSELFEIEAGRHTAVAVPMLKAMPGVENGQPGNFEIVIIDTLNGKAAEKVRSSQVRVEVLAQVGDRAAISDSLAKLEAYAANPAKVFDRVVTAELINGKAVIPVWDLQDTTVTDGQKVVYAKLLNNEGYFSETKNAEIFLDTVPPSLLVKSDKPLYRLEDTAVISVSSNEALQSPPVITAFVDAAEVAVQAQPEVLQEGYSYRYVLSVADDLGVAGAHADCRISVLASDDVGNIPLEAATVDFAVDAAVPFLKNQKVVICSGTDCSAAKTRGRAGDTISVSFDASEALGVPPAVSLGGNAMSACEGAAQFNYCYTISGAETDGPKQISIILTDTAGNTNAADSIVSEKPYIDVTAPQVLASLITPVAARAGIAVTISFTFSEPVSGYTLSAENLALDAATCKTADNQQFSCSYMVKGTENQSLIYTPQVTCSDAAGNLCGSNALGNLTIDYTEPVITPVSCSVMTRRAITRDNIASATAGDVVEVTLDADIEPGVSPLVTLGSQPLDEACSVPAVNCYARTVSDFESEGYKLVGIEAVDSAGNRYAHTVNIDGCLAQYDFTGPRITGQTLSRIPDFPPAWDESGKTLYFSITDPYSDAPVTARMVLSADEELLKDSVSVSGFSFGTPAVVDTRAVFQTILGETAVHGEKVLAVTWSDTLGNSATALPLEWKLFVDTEPPTAAVVDREKITYIRKPWGTRDTAYQPRFAISGEGAVSSSSIASVLVYSATGQLIGRDDTVYQTGAVSVEKLASGDLPVIYFSPVKRSGVKLSLGKPVDVPAHLIPVRHIAWYASMGGKEPGNTFTNPHKYELSAVFNATLEQDPQELTEPGISWLEAGNPPVTVDGHGFWKKSSYTYTAPLERANHAMAYDRSRGKIVLFGGLTTQGNDTWEWNGTNWVQLMGAASTSCTGSCICSDTTCPSARVEHAMEYNSLRGTVMLFGGAAGYPNYVNDTWEWNGVRWRKLETAVMPKTSLHTLAFDRSRGVMVLFGGMSNGVMSNDTYEWRNSDWVKIKPADSPAARTKSRMVYDSVRKKILLFGGFGGTNLYYNDTWEWDGTNWHKLTTAHLPPGRQGHLLIFDETRGKAVLYGGNNNTSGILNDIWEWDGSDWEKLEPSSMPVSRFDMAAVYDVAHEKTTVFGGTTAGSQLLNDTLLWDGADWKQYKNSSVPAPLMFHGAAFDRLRARLILFGGTAASGYRGETWEWDGASWQKKEPLHSPAARSNMMMTYDHKRKYTLLFGGTNGTPQADTWKWDGSDWEQLSSAENPSAAHSGALVYDEKREVDVLFGGLAGTTRFGETWVWDDSGWHKQSPSGDTPQPRYGNAMTFDSDRNRVVLFSGNVNGSYLNDTWEWDGSAWLKKEPAVSPFGRYYHGLAYDPGRKKTILYGGRGGVVYGDIWEWDGSQWTENTGLPGPAATYGHSFTYDNISKTVLNIGGYSLTYMNDVWQLHNGATLKPAQMVSVFFDTAGAGQGTINSVETFFSAGARGYTDGILENGIRLLVWSGGMWKTVDTDTSASPEVRKLLYWKAADTSDILPLFNGERLGVYAAVVPVASNGMGVAQVAVEDAGVVVHYILP